MATITSAPTCVGYYCWSNINGRPSSSAFRGRKLNWRFQCSSSSSSVTTSAVTPSSNEALDDNANIRLDSVIVGAGITGLTIAQTLATKHSNLLVTEARERVGGNITTVERDGYLWEEGPNSFQPSDAILTLVVDSGLKDELVLGDPNAPRYVFWEGKLRAVPSKPTDLPFFDLMSFPAKLRAAFGALGLRHSPPVRFFNSPFQRLMSFHLTDYVV